MGTGPTCGFAATGDRGILQRAQIALGKEIARTRTTHLMAPLLKSTWMRTPHFSISTNSEPRQHWRVSGDSSLLLRTFSGAVSLRNLSLFSLISPRFRRTHEAGDQKDS
jgi:hypothetical protein